MLRQQHRFFQSVLVSTDLALVVAANVCAYHARFFWLTDVIPPRESSQIASVRYASHAIPVLAAVPIMFVTMIWLGLYIARRDQRFYREASVVIRAVVIGTAMTAAFTGLFRNVLFDGRHYSGWMFVVYGGFVTLFLLTWRIAFRAGLRAIRAHGWNLRHVAIIGTGRLGQVAAQTFQRNSWTGIKPAYFISHHEQTSRTTCQGIPVRGGLDDLSRTLDTHAVSGVVIALPGRLIAEIPKLLPILERHPIEVRIVPDTNPKYMPINMSLHELEGMPILAVRTSRITSGWSQISKRATDLIGGLIALGIFGVPMLIITCLIKRSGPGPVIFRQDRISLNGQRFSIFKFRTMNDAGAEEQALRDVGRGTAAWTQPDDPRITRLGHFLRRTSLDELPQLFNVILGEMSLVGPRPERPELIDRFRNDWRGYMLRQNVKAGMTGWAQVNGLRGNSSLRKRLQYDLFYVRNWSWLFDVRILWLTVFRGFVHENAS